MVTQKSMMKNNNLWTHSVQGEPRWTLLRERGRTLCDSLRGRFWKTQTEGGGGGAEKQGSPGADRLGTAWPPWGASGAGAQAAPPVENPETKPERVQSTENKNCHNRTPELSALHCV